MVGVLLKEISNHSKEQRYIKIKKQHSHNGLNKLQIWFLCFSSEGLCWQMLKTSPSTSRIPSTFPNSLFQSKSPSCAVKQFSEECTLTYSPYCCVSLILRSNIVETTDKSYLKKCRYDEELHPYCPIFRLGDIVKRAGYKFQDMSTFVSIRLFIYLVIYLLDFRK